jgi:predicted Zn-ribbon and HTH transcriptional regulator
MTIRKQIAELTFSYPLTLEEISRFIQEHPKDVETHLQHLQKSVQYVFTILPAFCRKCEFKFRPKIRKPSKCPKCNSIWIVPPRFIITLK